MLRELRREFDLAIVFLTHEVGVAAVMHTGRIVEYDSVRDVTSNPSHPFRRGPLGVAHMAHSVRMTACRRSPTRVLAWLALPGLRVQSSLQRLPPGMQPDGPDSVRINPTHSVRWRRAQHEDFRQ